MMGGPDVEEQDLKTLEMLAPEDEEGTGISDSEEGDGLGAPI